MFRDSGNKSLTLRLKLAFLILGGAVGFALPIAAKEAPPAEQVAEEPKLIRFTASKKTYRIHVAWPDGVTFSQRMEGENLLVSFDKPLLEGHLSGFNKVPKWLGVVQMGYDALLIGVIGDRVRYRILQNKKGVVIEAQEIEVEKRDEAGGVDMASVVRLETIRARLLAETDEELEAMSVHQGLLSRYPDQLDAALVRPIVELRLRRWRHAMEWYNRTLRDFPDEPDIVRAKADLWRLHANFYQFGMNMGRVKNGESLFNQWLSGRRHLTTRLRVDWKLDRRDFHAPEVQALDGRIDEYDLAAEKVNAAFYYDHDDQSETGFSLNAAAGDGLGVGVSHALQDRFGTTLLGAAVKEPYWDLPSGLIGGGYRDRIYARRDHDFSDRTSGFLDLAYNRYGLKGLSQAATGVGLGAGLYYTLPWEFPRLTVGYRLDAEFRRTQETRQDPDDATFSPFVLVPREVHNLEFILTDQITDYLRMDLSGAWGYDRYSAASYLIGGALVYSPLADLEIGFSLSRSLTTGRAPNSRFTQGAFYTTLFY